MQRQRWEERQRSRTAGAGSAGDVGEVAPDEEAEMSVIERLVAEHATDHDAGDADLRPAASPTAALLVYTRQGSAGAAHGRAGEGDAAPQRQQWLPAESMARHYAAALARLPRFVPSGGGVGADYGFDNRAGRSSDDATYSYASAEEVGGLRAGRWSDPSPRRRDEGVDSPMPEDGEQRSTLADASHCGLARGYSEQRLEHWGEDAGSSASSMRVLQSSPPAGAGFSRSAWLDAAEAARFTLPGADGRSPSHSAAASTSALAGSGFRQRVGAGLSSRDPVLRSARDYSAAARGGYEGSGGVLEPGSQRGDEMGDEEEESSRGSEMEGARSLYEAVLRGAAPGGAGRSVRLTAELAAVLAQVESHRAAVTAALQPPSAALPPMPAAGGPTAAPRWRHQPRTGAGGGGGSGWGEEPVVPAHSTTAAPPAWAAAPSAHPTAASQGAAHAAHLADQQLSLAHGPLRRAVVGGVVRAGGAAGAWSATAGPLYLSAAAPPQPPLPSTCAGSSLAAAAAARDSATAAGFSRAVRAAAAAASFGDIWGGADEAAAVAAPDASRLAGRATARKAAEAAGFAPGPSPAAAQRTASAGAAPFPAPGPSDVSDDGGSVTDEGDDAEEVEVAGLLAAYEQTVPKSRLARPTTAKPRPGAGRGAGGAKGRVGDRLAGLATGAAVSASTGAAGPNAGVSGHAAGLGADAAAASRRLVRPGSARPRRPPQSEALAPVLWPAVLDARQAAGAAAGARTHAQPPPAHNLRRAAGTASGSGSSGLLAHTSPSSLAHLAAAAARLAHGATRATAGGGTDRVLASLEQELQAATAHVHGSRRQTAAMRLLGTGTAAGSRLGGAAAAARPLSGGAERASPSPSASSVSRPSADAAPGLAHGPNAGSSSGGVAGAAGHIRHRLASAGDAPRVSGGGGSRLLLPQASASSPSAAAEGHAHGAWPATVGGGSPVSGAYGAPSAPKPASCAGEGHANARVWSAGESEPRRGAGVSSGSGTGASLRPHPHAARAIQSAAPHRTSPAERCAAREEAAAAGSLSAASPAVSEASASHDGTGQQRQHDSLPAQQAHGQRPGQQFREPRSHDAWLASFFEGGEAGGEDGDEGIEMLVEEGEGE
jgi:hypothetical protein